MAELREQTRSVHESVYIALRKSIMNLNLAPGTLISEKEISTLYGVSRTPVREAFIRLSKEALLEVIPQKGTTVSLINFNRVVQERFMRKSLELSVYDLFLYKCSPFDFEALYDLVEKQAGCVERNDINSFIICDDALHKSLFDVAGQSLSWELVETMSGHYHRARILSLMLKGMLDVVLNQHRNLVDALKNRNIVEARRALTIHLLKLDTEEAILKEEFPDYILFEQKRDPFDVDFGGIQIS